MTYPHKVVMSGFSSHETEVTLGKGISETISEIRFQAIMFLGGSNEASLVCTQTREELDMMLNRGKFLVHNHQVRVFERGSFRPHRVFVRGLPSTATAVKLEAMLSAFQMACLYAVIFFYKSGRPKGFGFISYRTRLQAERLLRRTGKIKVGNRYLEFHVPNTKKKVEPNKEKRKWIEAPISRKAAAWDVSDSGPPPRANPVPEPMDTT